MFDDRSQIPQEDSLEDLSKLKASISSLLGPGLRVASLLVLGHLPEDDPERMALLESVTKTQEELLRESLIQIAEAAPAVASKIIQPAVAAGLKVQMQKEQSPVSSEENDGVFDLTEMGERSLHRFGPDPDTIEVAGDMRVFDPSFSGESISEGMDGKLQVEKEPVCARPGDVLMLATSKGTVCCEIEEIRKDPSTWLPYYIGRGRIVAMF